MDEYVKPSDVARRLGVSRQAIYKWIDNGKLKSARFGRTVRILRTSVEEFEREGREAAEKNQKPGLVAFAA